MFEVHVVAARNRFVYDRNRGSEIAAEAGAFRTPCHIPPSLLHPGGDADCADPIGEGGAVLLVGVSEDRIVAVSQLTPCTGPTRLRHLPQLASARQLPDCGTWAEWSRHPGIEGANRHTGDALFYVMACAVMEYALDEGVEWIGGIEEAYWLPRWESLDWDVRLLGLPCRVEGASSVAVFVRASERSLLSARRQVGVATPLLRRHGPQQPFLPSPSAALFSSNRLETDHAR